MFYSTPVMKPLIPDKAGLIGIGLAVLNAVMTVPPMILVDVSVDLAAKISLN
jgi:SP family facilitated glucose transporter-like MFS transporter 3